ncbi:MAG: isochorismatase family protein [Porphyromonas sp.]|nr:isochorismatase family protein [Porphyromonas sp.]
MSNILLIIDPQVDFVSGSLAVPGASQAMHWLAQWMLDHKDEYDAIYITMDQHPLDHCSFAQQGGPWPPHCVRYTVGAALEPAIALAVAQLHARGKGLCLLEKATTAERDAYSAFAQDIPEPLLTAERIYLAGLAGDYCVATSEADLLVAIPRERIQRLEEGIAWINKP